MNVVTMLPGDLLCDECGHDATIFVKLGATAERGDAWICHPCLLKALSMIEQAMPASPFGSDEQPIQRADVLALRTEVNCRIEHGAESGGHLEYVQTRLDALLKPAAAPTVTPDADEQAGSEGKDLRGPF